MKTFWELFIILLPIFLIVFFSRMPNTDDTKVILFFLGSAIYVVLCLILFELKKKYKRE